MAKRILVVNTRGVGDCSWNGDWPDCESALEVFIRTQSLFG